MFTYLLTRSGNSQPHLTIQHMHAHTNIRKETQLTKRNTEPSDTTIQKYTPRTIKRK